jgi:hypothetical protein
MFVIGFIGAVGAYIGVEAGLSVDFAAVAAALTGAIVWITQQAKLDVAKLRQFDKWKDKKFWIALAMVVVGFVDSFFELGLPVAEIGAAVNLVIGFVIQLIFKTDTA